MKISDRITKCKSTYSFDSVEAAEDFYKKILKEFDQMIMAGFIPENSKIKIFHDEDKVIVITDKTASSMVFEDYDD